MAIENDLQLFVIDVFDGQLIASFNCNNNLAISTKNKSPGRRSFACINWHGKIVICPTF